ncbi:MAG: aminoglycoside phosphotransferase family protein [Ginsengibacter sp.]
MKKLEKYSNLIHKDFPGFAISSISKTGEGDNSKAFIINENYIFRFPKREEVKQQIRREIAILPKIKSLLNLQIPQFEFVSPEINFVGYKIIPGTPLTFKIYNSLNKKQQASIQQSLGKFLSQLHDINCSIFSDCHLETMDLKEEYSDNFKKAQKFIYPLISKSKQKIITQLFAEYLNNPENFNYTPALIHNDFSKDHILFDAVNKHPPERIIRAGITGIIDFGDIAFGDPDYDLMYLWDEFGDDFLKGIFKIHQPKNKKELLNKLHFFSLANKIQIILGNRNDTNSEDLKNGYKGLNTWFKKFSPKK